MRYKHYNCCSTYQGYQNVGRVGRALYSLDQREKQGEYLSFEKDDIIVLSPVGATEGWWKGELVHTSSGQLKIGEKGLVPCSYVQTISFESVNDQKEYDLYSLLKVLNLFLLDSPIIFSCNLFKGHPCTRHAVHRGTVHYLTRYRRAS